MAKTKQDWALLLAERGVPIIPLHHVRDDGTCTCDRPLRPKDPAKREKGVKYCNGPGKHSPVPAWQTIATTDEDTIRDWFKSDPKMNYGCVAKDTLFLLDIDAKSHDGYKVAADIIGVTKADLTQLSFAVQTPTGGEHIYFLSDKAYGNSAGTLGAGLDSRSGNGYVVGPGSEVMVADEFDPEAPKIRVAYNVINDKPFEPIPPRLKGRLVESVTRHEKQQESLSEATLDSETSIKRAITLLKGREGAVEDGTGEHHTYVTACAVRDCNVSQEKALELMLEYWNDKCSPPWEVDELAGKVENAFRYAKRQVGSKGGGMMDLLDPDGTLAAETVLPPGFYDDEPEEKEKRSKAARNKFAEVTYDGASVLLADAHYDFIVNQWLPAKNYTIILGGRGSGKTTILMDMMCHVATDNNWHGTLVDPGWTVIINAAEDFAGVKERYEAWCNENRELCKFDHAQQQWRIPDPKRLQFMDLTINLLDKDEVVHFIEFIREHIKSITPEGQQQKVLLVVDTWQRATSAAEGGQSSDQSMQAALDSLEFIAKQIQGPCIIAAHPPKANADTMAGSAIIENRSDAIWKVDNSMGGRVSETKVTRIKGAPDGSYKTHQMKTVGISGVTKFGETRKSVVAHCQGGTVDTGSAKANLTQDGYERSQAFLMLLREILAKKQVYNPNDARLPTMKNICALITELPLDKKQIIELRKNSDTSETGARDESLKQSWLFQLNELGFSDAEIKPQPGKPMSEHPIVRALMALRHQHNGRGEIGKTGMGIVWTQSRKNTVVMEYTTIRKSHLLDQQLDDKEHIERADKIAAYNQELEAKAKKNKPKEEDDELTGAPTDLGDEDFGEDA